MAKDKAKDGKEKVPDAPPPLVAGPGEVVVRAKKAIVVGGVRTAPGGEAVISSGLAESYGKEYVEVLPASAAGPPAARSRKADEADGRRGPPAKAPKGDEPPKGEGPEAEKANPSASPGGEADEADGKKQ